MGRIRLTQIFPFLIPLRKKQRKALFYKQMERDDHRYTLRQEAEVLEHLVYEKSEVMVNENSGYDIKYQYNKVENLKLAAGVLNGLILTPGEVFSFWQVIRHADKHEPFKDGLVLVNGKITELPGGGLCQLSNMLYEILLHSPLTTVERTAHDIESFYFPDKVYGIDATVSEGWLDLKVKNATADTYQITVDFPGNTHIRIGLHSDAEPTHTYRIYNLDNEVYQENGKHYRKVAIWKKETNLATGEESEHYLYTDKVGIGYNINELNKEEEQQEA